MPIYLEGPCAYLGSTGAVKTCGIGTLGPKYKILRCIILVLQEGDSLRLPKLP